MLAYRAAALLRLIYFDAFVGQRDGLVQIGRGVTYTGTVQIVLGPRVFLGCNGIFQGSGRIAIGARTYVGNFFDFNCRSHISIGEKCLLGNFVTVVDNDHRTRASIDIMDQGFDTAAVRIERNCWIGEKATILSGVTVHENAVVAAGSVVTRDVPRNAVVAGVPARVMRIRSQAAG